MLFLQNRKRLSDENFTWTANFRKNHDFVNFQSFKFFVVVANIYSIFRFQNKNLGSGGKIIS